MKEILLSLHIEKLPEGVYLATCENLPGLVAQGRTLEETLEIARDVARKLNDSYRENGDELPSGLHAFDQSADVTAAVGV